MKNLKKLASLLLVLVMVFALAAPALAVDEATTGSITISNAVAGQTYNVYKVFDLSYGGSDVDGDENAPHTYTVADGWEAFFSKDGDGLNYVAINNFGGVTWKTDVAESKAAEFAEKALAFATENGIQPVATRELAGDPTKDPDQEITFEGLALGYYLIDSSLGSLCTLDSTNKNVTVVEKNEKPSITKEIPQPEGLKVGDAVEYKIVVKAMRGATKYVVTDTMTNLTFNQESLKVQHMVDGVLTDYPSDQYTLVPEESGFILTFKDEYLKGITDALESENAHEITITYTGTITTAALEYDEINNTAKLEFGDKGNPDSTPDKDVSTPLYSFDLVKTDSENKLLNGAVFQLTDSEGNEISLVFDEANGYYRPAVESDTADTIVNQVTTNDTNVLTFKGFGEGTYYLEEIMPPDGYNKLKDPVVVEVNRDNSATMNADGTVWTAGGVHVINLTGAELPNTGGIGTTLFYIVGGLLIVGAAVLLVTKKRMSGEEQ